MDIDKVIPDILDLDGVANVASTTDCTGLMQTPPLNEYEDESYRDIYSLEAPSADR